MNRSMKKLLKRLYTENSLPCSEALKLLENRFGDHRDFYQLAALVEAGYLGCTGGIPGVAEPFRTTLMAQTFQCYRQGRGQQRYKLITVLEKEGADESYFYIGPKTIELFETRRSDSKKLLASAGLSFFAAVIVAVIAYLLRNGS